MNKRTVSKGRVDMGFDSSSLMPLVHTSIQSKHSYVSCEAEFLALLAIKIEMHHGE